MIKHVWLKINGLHEQNITDDKEEEEDEVVEVKGE